MTNEDYFEKLNSIRYLIMLSYIDYSLIDIIDRLKSKGDINHNSAISLSHILLLLKNDIVLNTWKIWLDGKATTLYKMNSELKAKYQKETKCKKPSELKKCENDIKTARNKFISHNDSEHNSFSLDMSVLKNILDETRIFYNGLCYSDIDSRIKKITDKEIAKIMLAETLSFMNINNIEVN